MDKYIGKRLGLPGNEAEHFMRCATCDGYFDTRISVKFSSIMFRCGIWRKINRNTGPAQGLTPEGTLWCWRISLETSRPK
jgi:hypothetical protein